MESFYCLPVEPYRALPMSARLLRPSLLAGLALLLALRIPADGAESASAPSAASPPSAPAPAAAPAPCDWQRWQNEIDAFDAADQRHAAPAGVIVFVGSSSIRLWDLGASFPGLATLNRGFGGSQLCDTVHFFDRLVVRHRPSQVVVYAGDNDLAAGKTPEQVHADFRALVALLKRDLPQTPLTYIAVKPSVARWKLAAEIRRLNRLIADDCERDPQLHFLDVWPPTLDAQGEPRSDLLRDDGLHLNDAGYAVWSDLLRPLLTASASQTDR